MCEGTGENIFVVRDGVILTPPQTAGILDGINRKSIIQIARDLGYEIVERDLARAELYLADEVFMSGTAAEMVPVCEIDDHRIGEGVAGTGDPGGPDASSSTRCTAATTRYREWLDVVKVPSRSAAMSARIELYDTTLRDGMQGEGMSLSAGEKLRVAHRLDELGLDLIEAGFPSSNPKELELFGLLARRVVRARPDLRLRDDPPARDWPPTPTRRCASSPTASPRCARWWARPGACTWRRWSRSTATRTCG